jgi:non-ribosomal peptide synthetase component F
MRPERLTLFAALRQAIPDEYLFDPALGSAFYRHLKWLYKWAYLDPAPGQRTQ